MINSVFIFFNLSIVSSRHKLCTQLFGSFNKFAELNELITTDTRVGCFTFSVARNKIIDNIFLEWNIHVHGVKWNLELLTNSAGIFLRAQRTTNIFAYFTLPFLLPKVHKNT